MYFNDFNQLSDEQKKAGRRQATATEEIKLRGQYGERYARTNEKSSEIVRDLSQEFPEINVPEALRPIMIHSRE